MIAAVLTRWEACSSSKHDRGAHFRYYVLSGPPSGRHWTAAEMARAIQRHWSIENELHQVLDRSLGEDAGRNRVGDAAQVVSLLRGVALTLLWGSGPWPATKRPRQRQRILLANPKKVLNL